ncbi:MAG: EamA family transporter [Rubrivivax sp.]
MSIVAFNFCTAFAQLNTSTSRAAVLTYAMPMLSTLLAWALLGERPGRRSSRCCSAHLASRCWPEAGAGVVGAGAEAQTCSRPLFALRGSANAPGIGHDRHEGGTGADRVVATAWQLALGGACGALATWLAGETWPRGAFAAGGVGARLPHRRRHRVRYVLWYRLLDSASATVSSLTVLVPVR